MENQEESAWYYVKCVRSKMNSLQRPRRALTMQEMKDIINDPDFYNDGESVTVGTAVISPNTDYLTETKTKKTLLTLFECFIVDILVHIHRMKKRHPFCPRYFWIELLTGNSDAVRIVKISVSAEVLVNWWRWGSEDCEGWLPTKMALQRSSQCRK